MTVPPANYEINNFNSLIPFHSRKKSKKSKGVSKNISTRLIRQTLIFFSLNFFLEDFLS